MKSVIKSLVIGVLVTSLAILIGCGTVEGFGHDVSSAGHAIQRAA
jgi:predicted small secreted protein